MILAILTTVGIIELLFIIMAKKAPTGKFRHFLLHQACWLILVCSGIKVNVKGKEFIPNELTEVASKLEKVNTKEEAISVCENIRADAKRIFNIDKIIG